MRKEFRDPYWQWFFDYCFIFLAPMMIYSHYVTSTCEIYTFNRTRMDQFVDEGTYQVSDKEGDKKWKPMRSHHCSVCQRGVRKMDHHCPLAMHCIGDRNHKPFL